jgi:hypothetical protein
MKVMKIMKIMKNMNIAVMKKRLAWGLAWLLFLTAIPVWAVSVVRLEINENFTPGPDPQLLTVTGILSDGIRQKINTGLKWSSSNEDIARVYGDGLVSFSGKPGVVTVTVRMADIPSVTTSKTFNVSPWPTRVTIETNLLYSDNPYRLLVRATMSDETERYLGPTDNVIWSSSNPWVAWVNSEGVVTFTGEDGYVEITAVVGSYSDRRNTEVSGSAGSNTAFPRGIRISTDILYSVDPLQLQLVSVMTDNSEQEIPSLAAEWTSSNPAVATVSRDGLLRFTGAPGFTTVQAKYGGYATEKLVSVGRHAEKISIDQTLNYTPVWDGQPLPLSATVRYNDGSVYQKSTDVTWASSNNAVAGIDREGKLTFTGSPGVVTVTVSAPGGVAGAVVSDSVTVTVPDTPKGAPSRLLIENNLYPSDEPVYPRVICLYTDGTVRDVTDLADITSSTPLTATVFEKAVYLSPNQGRVQIQASYESLTDTAAGYSENGKSSGSRTHQLIIKERYIPYKGSNPTQLTGLAVQGDGSVRDVTSQLRWQSSQPLIARITAGRLTYTGRVGTAKISVQGFGLRSEMELEVTPEMFQSRAESLVIQGTLDQGANTLSAIATMNTGEMKDVTKEAIWNISNQNVAKITEDGTVVFPEGLKPLTVTASYGGVKAELSRA